MYASRKCGDQDTELMDAASRHINLGTRQLSVPLLTGVTRCGIMLINSCLPDNYGSIGQLVAAPSDLWQGLIQQGPLGHLSSALGQLEGRNRLLQHSKKALKT